MGKKGNRKNKQNSAAQRRKKNHIACSPETQKKHSSNIPKTYSKTISLAGTNLSKKCNTRNRSRISFAAVRFLVEPSRLFSQPRPKTEAILTLAGFLGMGFFLNAEWSFPNFLFYVIIFSLIFTTAYLTLSYFYHSMRTLHREVTGLSPFDKSEYFYIEKTESSPFYFIFPLCFILAFGVCGSIIYGAISFTPTFVWCLLYFTVVVYFSMLAYSQYIRFFVYLYIAAHNTIQFENMIMPDQQEFPPKFSWLIRIANISHVLNLMFFAVGGLYILAFATFCFSPVYHVEIGAGLFYMLWIIIFVFIVLAFPIICYQKTADIKRLVSKIKHCYIREILMEDHFRQSMADGIGQLSTIIRNYCISIILDTPNYPTNGKLNTVYSAVGVIINFVASIATILEYQGIQLFHT